MERFLYRLSKSNQADRFILKGALMLRAWRSPEFRSTMDIDLLGKTSNDEVRIVEQIREIMSVETEPDGLEFDLNSVYAERITENADYEGVRIRFRGLLGTAKVTMQIDIGFGDVVYPGPEESDLPSMLDFPAPRLLCYSRESAIAEKFEAMVKLGILNSRMKDFYDIWLLSRLFDFDGAKLTEAIRLTFKQRGTFFSDSIEAFTEPFIDAKQVQWTAFWRRLQQEHIPRDFREISLAINTFLTPIVSAFSLQEPTPEIWTAPGPWS